MTQDRLQTLVAQLRALATELAEMDQAVAEASGYPDREAAQSAAAAAADWFDEAAEAIIAGDIARARAAARAGYGWWSDIGGADPDVWAFAFGEEVSL